VCNDSRMPTWSLRARRRRAWQSQTPAETRLLRCARNDKNKLVTEEHREKIKMENR